MEFQAMHRLPVASCRLQVAGCKLGGQSAFNYWQQAAPAPQNPAAPAVPSAPPDSGSKQSSRWSNFFGGWQRHRQAAKLGRTN